MKIYISHSKNFDYKKLYEPIKSSELFTLHEFIFPHENDQVKNSKEIIQNADLVIAEVSFGSIGVGIELGWAEDARVKIICVHKADSKISNSLQLVSSTILEYSGTDELIQRISSILKS